MKNAIYIYTRKTYICINTCMHTLSLSYIYIEREREIDIAIDTDTDRDVDIDLGKYNIVRRTMLCGDSTNIQLCTYVHTYVHAYIQKHIYIYVYIHIANGGLQLHFASLRWRSPAASQTRRTK